MPLSFILWRALGRPPGPAPLRPGPLCGFESQPARRPGLRANPFQLNDPKQLNKIRNDLPVLLVAGDADPINEKLAGLKRLEVRWKEAGVKRIDRQVYKGGRHEMLNETNRDEVTASIVKWIDEAVLGESPAKGSKRGSKTERADARSR